MFKNTFDLAGLLAALLLTLASSAHAGLYKCTDSHNKTYYQDKPCQDLISARLPNRLTSIAGRPDDRAFLWKAVGDKGTLYLLGSLQYGTQDMLPLPQGVMDVFGTSQVVLVEMDLGNLGEKERNAILKGRGRYEGKESNMEIHVKSVTWAKAVEAGNKLGINEEILRQYKPWLAALIFSTESLKQAGYSPDFNLAQSFTKQSEAKKPVMELESLEEQIKSLDSLSDKEQEQLLLQTLQELGRGPEYYKNLADAWKKGDVEAMDMFVRQGYESSGTSNKLFKLLVEDPNERITNRLKELSNEDKTYFVVVGAARLGGDRGILKLLEGKGFKITQP